MKTPKILSLFALILLFAVSCGDNSSDPQVDDPAFPLIQSLDKQSYTPKGFIVIKGKRFAVEQGRVIVPGNLEAKIYQWNDSVIRCELPVEAVSGDLYVRRADGKESNKVALVIEYAGADPFPIVLINKGTFTMGIDDANDQYGASPAHKVTISYDFYMAATEVTQKQYVATTGKNPFPDKGDELPANHIGYFDAIDFCNKLSTKWGFEPCYKQSGNNDWTCDFTKNGYRLPTEAEWEYAAHGGTNVDYGTNTYAWYADNTGSSTYPKPVKQKQPNGYGLYDMNGNVSEWVWDNYDFSYYEKCKHGVTDPTGSTTDGGNKVIRGGNFQSDKSKIKSTSRDGYNYGNKNYDIGFRFVRRK